MSARALLTRDDAERLAGAARAHQCVIEVKRGDVIITIRPSGEIDRAEPQGVSLSAWRKRHENKGQGRA